MKRTGLRLARIRLLSVRLIMSFFSAGVGLLAGGTNLGMILAPPLVTSGLVMPGLRPVLDIQARCLSRHRGPTQRASAAVVGDGQI